MNYLQLFNKKARANESSTEAIHQLICMSLSNATNYIQKGQILQMTVIIK